MTSTACKSFRAVSKDVTGWATALPVAHLPDTFWACTPEAANTTFNGKRTGYQGEFYIASGISYGYSAPIARRLNLEFSIGIGLLRTNYEHYHAIDDYQTLLWQNDGNYTWFGPTKIKISLVWLLGGRKGGER